MLKSLFDRWFGRKPARVPMPLPAAAPVATRSAEPARVEPARPSVGRASREPGPPPVGLGARRALIGPRGVLAGFEFYAGVAGRHRLRRLEDETTTRACTAHVLGAMRLCLGQEMSALAEIPASWLARSADESFCAGMRIVVCPDRLCDDPLARARLLTRLRGLGVAVGRREPESADLAPVPDERPDFLLVQLPPTADIDTWRRTVAELRTLQPGVPLVLIDLPAVDVMEALLVPPVVLAASRLGADSLTTANTSATQTLSPQSRHLMQLMHRLVRDDDTALLIRDIKADAALSLRLLQYLNSAGATPGRELDSVDQAVMVLGRDALYRWVSQMLVRLSPPRGASAALQSMALARARLMELLARSAGDPNPGALYLFGLVSMLPLLLRCELDDAVATLKLPPMAVDALRHQRGPWFDYLALSLALERHDMPQLETLAQAFGGVEAVLACSVRAWLQD